MDPSDNENHDRWRESVWEELEAELGDAFTEAAYDARIEALEAESCLECDRLWKHCQCWSAQR